MKQIPALIIIVSLAVMTAATINAALTPLTLTTVKADTVSTIKKGVKDSGAKRGDNTAGLLGTVRTVVNILLFVIGAGAVIAIIVAGLRFVTANGDSGTISSARNTIIYAIIGLVVAFAAFAIVNFITQQLGR